MSYLQDEHSTVIVCPLCEGEGTLRGPFFDTICFKCEGEGEIWVDPNYVSPEEEDEYPDDTSAD